MRASSSGLIGDQAIKAILLIEFAFAIQNIKRTCLKGIIPPRFALRNPFSHASGTGQGKLVHHMHFVVDMHVHEVHIRAHQPR